MPRLRPSFRTRAPRPDARRLLAAAVGAALAPGCAGATRPPAGATPAPAGPARVITGEEIVRSGYLTPRDVVGALRPGWLLAEAAARRGPDTLLEYAPRGERAVGFVYVHADSARGFLRRSGAGSATGRPPFPMRAVTAMEFVPPSTVLIFGRDSAGAGHADGTQGARPRTGVGR